eukprot:TRINITY_DN10977_c0_g3_i1.p3 TRINITY_DN10977_c0_g3~~TRINITY_DN10977_c0_g3_i1.p3  ORF type:complete len:220 (+),score=92.18 TRINITY_DN10977_c0_g3_i1:1218-1877(+)
MGLFSSKPKKKKQSQVTNHDRAVLELKVSRDKLCKYQKKLTVLIEKEVDASKTLLKEGKKDRALVILKRKKMKEQMLSKADDQLTNLQQLVDSVESAQLETRIAQAMKEGSEALRDIQKEFSVEYIEQLMEDTAEAIAIENEISELLAGSLTPQDDEDTLAELAALEKKMAEEELALPPVPDHPLPDAGKVKDPTPATTAETEKDTQEETDGGRVLAAA